MSKNAVNSGAINAVGFPGAEQGDSVIQLVGTVTVVGTLAGLKLRLTASAPAAPKATTGASIIRRLAIGAAIACVASASSVSRPVASR